MRIALISDLHANEVALDAVLDDIKQRGVDRIICLGDAATLGPRPGATLQTLRDLGCPCIMGNHDAFMLDPNLIRTYTEVSVIIDAVDWCRDQLTPHDLDFLRTFQPSMTLALTPETSLLLFHGSPRSHMEDLLATTPPDELDRMLGEQRATIMAGGHTHIQMLRQHRGALLLNPGSVGLPFKEYVAGQAPTLLPHAEYAIVEGTSASVHVDLHRVAVDKGAMRAAAAASDNPLRGMLLQHYA